MPAGILRESVLAGILILIIDNLGFLIRKAQEFLYMEEEENFREVPLNAV